MCKLTLLENDRRMLEWLNRPRQGNDAKAVGRALDNGTFIEILGDIELLVRARRRRHSDATHAISIG